MTEQNRSAIDHGRTGTNLIAAGNAPKNAIDSAKKAIDAIENVENPSVGRVFDEAKDVSSK